MELKQATKNKFLKVFENWKKTSPDRFRQTIERMKLYRKSRANVFGSDKQKEFRFEFTIPAELYQQWEEIYPDFINQKWIVNWLAKEFKELLRVSERW